MRENLTSILIFFVVVSTPIVGLYLFLQKKNVKQVSGVAAGRLSKFSNPPLFLQTIWFWWIALTLLYTIVSFYHIDVTPVVFLVGLFVPMGFVSLFGLFLSALVRPESLFVVPAFLAALSIADMSIRRYIKKPLARIIAAFVVLFILTVGVDVFLYGCWQSYNLFFDQDIGLICGSPIE